MNQVNKYIFLIDGVRFPILCILLLLSFSTYGQRSYRRHFLIAYDVSTPFVRSEKNSPAFKQALIDLFSNQHVSGFNEGNENNLIIERKNGVPFFDKKNDQVSFIHFNIAESEFGELRRIAENHDEKINVSEFQKRFLKDKHFDWESFSKNNNYTIADYLDKAFSIAPQPADFGGGVSMSNFVYPLILNNIDTGQYAKEYILIILSDFLTGSMLGNTEDLDRVKDIYRVPYERSVTSNSPVNYIKKEIDYLASQYYRIDFFSYAFTPVVTSKRIGIISYKIKPKVGVLTPEDVSLFVDGDLSLNQQGYHSAQYKTSATKIKFTHNNNLSPTELTLTIAIPTGKTQQVLFSGIVASKNANAEWVSDYTSGNDLMKFDSAKLTYTLPAFTLDIDPSINNKGFDNLVFQYDLKARYAVTNSNDLNFIYSTQRGVPVENIHYSTKATIIIMYYVIPFLLILVLIGYLIYRGKPKALFIRLAGGGYLDSFERTDYKTFGKLVTPYIAWNNQTDDLHVDGELRFNSPAFPFNWNPDIYVRVQAISLPEGFDVYLKVHTGDIKEYARDTVMAIHKSKNNRLSFFVGIRQNDINKEVKEPLLIKLKIEAAIKHSVALIKAELTHSIEYNFHVGPDLDDVWVGFDPGTSGSCMAVGRSTENIEMVKDIRVKDNKEIIPSLLSFDMTEEYHPNGTDLPDTIYAYGNVAHAIYENTSRFKTFQSIKKLLGYKDIQEVTFANSNCLQLKGKDIASLLVKGLYKDVDSYMQSLVYSEEYTSKGKFDPKRAVVAIPNNFTISKIQDMIDCIDNIGQFKEIRYIYEAEAVLFYYLSDPTKFCGKSDLLDTENILVFDMGGATINATVVTTDKIIENKQAKYDIDYLGKIGYGIGGDTIDYCICRFILGCAGEYPQLAAINIHHHKIALSRFALEIKKEIIRNYYAGKNYLITAANLERFINAALGITISIANPVDSETEGYVKSKMYDWFLKNDGRFKLFEHPLFVKTIYNNVRDAVNEVMALSGNMHINKVIFSGRSTAFPMIKETVQDVLKIKENKIKVIALDLVESKTAVARGSCWYGINKNAIKLNNLKTNASFGFKRTLSANKKDVHFQQLVKMGQTFNTWDDTASSFEGIEPVSSNFAFDGNKVNFYQVMGSNINKILGEDERHKYSKIATIRLPQSTSKIAMKVNENDEVECVVQLESNRKIFEKGLVSDQEIEEANAEHYTWIIK